ncbi:MAG: class I SAM-dependent methyltransferase [Candidatus Sumerlaeaceae bacterium]|nr:class I SAM-dependent methyltransferase [Candidatus Sumerlaeaceae bacterium]
MSFSIKSILSNATCYHYFRQALTGGMPFHDWVSMYGFQNEGERIADLGCGPADILRFLKPRAPKPEFYLGIDLSEKYLDSARARARAAGLNSECLALDLEKLPTDSSIQKTLMDLLQKHRITRVLLMGVLHHIDDASALTTLNLVHAVETVRCMMTSDVVRIPGARINNFYLMMDRGQFIRPESGYDELVATSSWEKSSKIWSSPRLSAIRYLHYKLEK